MLDRRTQSELRELSLNVGRGLPTAVASGAALALVYLFWGFTVDDAWIVSRVADLGKTSGRFSFNPGGSVTDAVTPLGYAHLLAALSWVSGVESFQVARVLGAASWVGVWSFLSQMLVGERGPARALGFGLVPLLSVPGAAWAGAGLETPLIALLLSVGLVKTLGPGQRWWGPLVLGLGGALRPECLPACWVATAFAPGTGWKQRSHGLIVASLAPLLVVVLRIVLFGHPLPLAATAKPADLSSGLQYVQGLLLFSGTPFLWLSCLWIPAPLRNTSAPDSPRIQGPSGVAVAAIAVAFLGSLVLSGGDWMPLFRLGVPFAPWFAFECFRRAPSAWGLGVGVFLGLVSATALGATFHRDAVATLETRLRWVRRGRGVLQNANVIATVDVGWVGRATSKTIVDLSGVTDRSIARLPGGHTSHRVPAALLDARGVDTWLVRAEREGGVLVEPSDLQATYRVDARLLNSADTMGFRVACELPIERTDTSYFVLMRAGVQVPAGTCEGGPTPARPSEIN